MTLSIHHASPDNFYADARSVAAKLRPLLVFAGTRWGFDHQRPQQLLTRLARHYRIYYIEEPVFTHRDATLETFAVVRNLEIVVPHTRVDAPGFSDPQMPVLSRMLEVFMRERDLAEPVVWLYTPMALPLVDALSPRAVVYDCVLDLSTASGAAPLLLRSDETLMKRADVVFVSGPSLYESRRQAHSNVHCLPNAVEAEHFTPVGLSGETIAAISARSIHASIPGPRLGWFGVIDASIDLSLLESIAQQRPDWQIVMAGPVIGIDAATLPRRSNIHWIGPQTYEILPHLMTHWDVCILPFATDASTRFASPHQTLQCLAAQKPVVSTPVHDVVALHGHIVRFAGEPGEFVEACRSALSERGPLRRQRRLDAMIAVHSCTWDRTAHRAHKLLVARSREATDIAWTIEPSTSVPTELLSGAATAAQAARGSLRSTA